MGLGRQWWARALEWFRARDFDEGATLMAFGALIGVAGGLAVVGFYRLIDLSYHRSRCCIPTIRYAQRSR